MALISVNSVHASKRSKVIATAWGTSWRALSSTCSRMYSFTKKASERLVRASESVCGASVREVRLDFVEYGYNAFGI